MRYGIIKFMPRNAFWRNILRLLIVASSFGLPQAVHAQVVISEFVYDAPGSDTGAEWVELFNAGSSPIDLTKWKINDGSNHVLNVPPKNGGIGSITINSGAYIVLAADATFFEGQYPDIANVIDTTLSLPNTSGTVSLIDDNGVTVDSFSYTKDEGASGDGNSLQRTSASETAFTVSAPTPGSGSLTALAPDNADSGTDNSNTGTTSTPETSQQTQTMTSAPTNSYVPPPVPLLFADAGNDRTVIVGADTVFDARAYDRDQDKVVSPVRFLWNFGDGATAEGESVLHHFSYPGRYAVFLDIAQNKEAVSDRIIVTAEPAKLAFRALPDGSIVIENDAGRDLDLSDWIVRQYAQLFMLPAHSVVLAGQSMHIPQQTLGFWANASSELAYPNGVSVLKAGESSSESTPPTVASPAQTSAISSVSSEPIYKTAAASVPSASPEISVPDPDPSPAESSPINEPAISSQGAATGLIGASSRLWWLAALILTLAAGGSLIAAQHVGKREWDIVEEKPE